MSWGDTLILVISRGVQLYYGIAQLADILPIGIVGPQLPLTLLLHPRLIKLICWKWACTRVFLAKVAKYRKHTVNDPKCVELGWRYIPLAVESHGAWGPKALRAFLQVGYSDSHL